MIATMIGIYLFAWWGVFMLLMPQRSLVRVWAFIPAALCAFGIPAADPKSSGFTDLYTMGGLTNLLWYERTDLGKKGACSIYTDKDYGFAWVFYSVD
jgi:hypothetical protein